MPTSVNSQQAALDYLRLSHSHHCPTAAISRSNRFNLPATVAIRTVLLDAGDDTNEDYVDPGQGLSNVVYETDVDEILRFLFPALGDQPPGWTLGTESKEEPPAPVDDVFQQGLFPNLGSRYESDRPLLDRSNQLGASLAPFDFTGGSERDQLREFDYRELHQSRGAATEDLSPFSSWRDNFSTLGRSNAEADAKNGEGEMPRRNEETDIVVPTFADRFPYSMAEFL